MHNHLSGSHTHTCRKHTKKLPLAGLTVMPDLLRIQEYIKTRE